MQVMECPEGFDGGLEPEALAYVCIRDIDDLAILRDIMLDIYHLNHGAPLASEPFWEYVAQLAFRIHQRWRWQEKVEKTETLRKIIQKWDNAFIGVTVREGSYIYVE
jgi:hypothetical protein